MRGAATSDGLTRALLPSDVARRSGLYRKLQQQGAVFGEIAGGALPMRYRDEDDEAALARHLGLSELSALPRLGFKGKSVLSQMNTEGVTLEFRPNRAFRQEDGTLAAELAMTEVLLLSPACTSFDQYENFEQRGTDFKMHVARHLPGTGKTEKRG